MQLVEAIDRVCADAGDDVAQVCLGLDAVELRATDERVEEGGANSFFLNPQA